MDSIIYLNKENFNNNYAISQMTKNSVIVVDKHSEVEKHIFIHRRVLNKILMSEESMPCAIVDREYRGRVVKWMATFFTI